MKLNRGYKSHATLPRGVDPASLDEDRAVAAFVQPFVDLERQMGASVIVAPYVHASTNEMLNVHRSLRCAAVASALVGGTPLLAGLSVDASIVEDDATRASLLDELSASNVAGFFILVDDGHEGFAQVDRVGLLLGLRDLVTTLRAARQVTFFARVGALGLPLVVHGAGGFSTGAEAKTMHGSPPAPADAPAAQAQRAVPRFYERSLFTLLRYTESRDARRPDPTTGTAPLARCGCTFCTSGSDLMDTASAWSVDRAARHMLWALTQDVDELRALPVADRRQSLKDRTATALSERAALRQAKVVVLPEGMTPNYKNWQDAFL